MDEPLAEKVPNPGENGHAGPPRPIDLLIRMNPITQDVEVVGPLEQRLLCYGMLEMARASIDDTYLKAELAESQSRIVPASGPLPPFPPRR